MKPRQVRGMSLGRKLILGSVLIEIVMLTVLAANSIRIVESSLPDHAVVRAELVRQSLAIVVAEVALTVVLIALVAAWLTRHLKRLEEASIAVARGDYELAVRIDSDDELGRLAAAFNTMTAEVRRTLKELDASQARFCSLTEMSSDFYWESDAEHRLTRRTDSAREVAESASIQAASIGRRRWEIPHLAPDERGWQEHRATLEAHLSFRDFEIAGRRPDGTVRHTSISGDAVFDGLGRFAGYRGVGADISERKQAQLALRESEERHRTVLQTAMDGFWLADARGGLLEVNEAYCRMSGYSAGELLAMNLSDLEADQTTGDAIAHILRVVAQDEDRFESRHRRKDGTVFDVEVSVRYLAADGGRLAGFVKDITERNHAEGAARAAREQMKAMTDATPGVVHQLLRTAAGELRFSYVSSGCGDLFGVSPEEALRDHDVLSSRIVAEDRAGHRESLERSALTLGAWAHEYRIGMPDGAVKWVRGWARPQRQDDGTTLWNGILVDVTERHRAEAERAALEAQARETQKMEALGTLAGGVAHDFNNALATILGNVALARNDVGAGHAALVSLEEIGKASRRAKDLVQQILAFGRRQKLERKATSLTLVVVESARLVRATLPARVSLSVDCDPKSPAVLADAAQVTQILLNLCSNALQAAQDQDRPGLVGISLHAHTQCEQRGDLPAGRYACLTVTDNGEGMDNATRERIFEPFYTTRSAGKGTGLGLSVVHGIVRAHEALLEVTSAAGEGSEFRVYFPAVETPVDATAEQAPDQAPVPAPVQGKGRHVLYVDDEEAIIFLMKRLLERQGFRVSGYTDPREALAAVRADPCRFDLVVTDYSMPGLSGLELAHALKDLRPDLPVVLASGYITDELRARAPAAGIRELIYKPNTADDLCAAVARFADAGTYLMPSRSIR